jgi:hypothetical protein
MQVMQEISRSDLQHLETRTAAKITNVRHLSSYNWIDAPTPTIVVPGCPALWSPPTSPHQLNQDSGLVYIAQNAARLPESPLEPLFRSLYITNPSFKIQSSDVVAERNAIRKLLAFVARGEGTGNPFHAFAMKLEAVGNTVMFSLIERATHEVIGPDEFKGFGHEFEKAYTTNQIKNSTGHHRIISYQFGRLSFIICHETDGYANQKNTLKPPGGEESGFSYTSVESPPSALHQKTGTTLTVKSGGKVIPLGLTIEIKTRVSQKPILIDVVAPQLWVSQTPKLVRAYHRGGLFQRPQFDDVTDELSDWEARNESHLKILAALIGEIVAIVRRCGAVVVLRYDPLGDKLILFAGGGTMLPEDLYSRIIS